MGAYKRDVVVVIKMGAYIHGVLILCGCLLSRFYVYLHNGLIGIVEPVRAITVHVHGRFLSDILIQLGDMINK